MAMTTISSFSQKRKGVYDHDPFPFPVPQMGREFLRKGLGMVMTSPLADGLDHTFPSPRKRASF